MPLIRNGRIADDSFRTLADDAPLPDAGAILVSLERWRAERERLLARPSPVGVSLKNTQAVADIAEDLPRLQLVALEFPGYRDGRAYSQARLIRERFRYAGELRATGQVLRDQILFMLRCGFDAFQTDDPRVLEHVAESAAEFSVFFQPTGDGRATAEELRRRPGRAAVR